MIPIVDAKELREQLDTLLRASKLLAESFENDEAGDDTISEDMLIFMEDRTDNVRDIAMGLARSIARLQGRAEGKWLEAPQPGVWSDTDEKGNTIHRITLGCAPCSEIGRSFATERRPEGLRAQLISGMAKDLSLRPAGEVRWLLANTGQYSDAPAFDREQWEKLLELAIHRGLIPGNGTYYPPPRMANKGAA